jgi:large subunit ribosomal protein L4
MTLDVVNRRNEKVGSIDLGEAAFGGQADIGLVWESVVQENAAARRGTHSTKTRGEVRGSGRKPWRQKGTGRARVGEIRSPLWRTGGTVFGPQPRSYAYSLPKKVVRRALRAALVQKLHDGAVTVVDQLSVEEPKTRQAVELLAGLDVAGSALLVDRKSGEHLKLAVRNLSKVRVVDSNQVTARDVAAAARILMTPAAVEHLEKVLAS